MRSFLPRHRKRLDSIGCGSGLKFGSAFGNVAIRQGGGRHLADLAFVRGPELEGCYSIYCDVGRLAPVPALNDNIADASGIDHAEIDRGDAWPPDRRPEKKLIPPIVQDANPDRPAVHIGPNANPKGSREVV
jgi:hypothetical protein